MVTRARLGYFEIDPLLATAVHRGFLRAEGVQLDLEQVGSSRAQFTDLASGKYDLVLTAFDNVANYALNTVDGAGGPADVAAVLPISFGSGLTLVGAAGIEDVGRLRGRTVSVDAPRSGFAFVVYALLELAGLVAGEDYRVVSHGGAAQRLDRLVQGDADATLLTADLTDQARGHGLLPLGAVGDVVDPYQGLVLAARRSGPVDLLRSVVAAWEAARTFVLDAEHAPEVVEALRAIAGADESRARRAGEAARLPSGLAHGPAFDPSALRNTLELRRRYHGFDTDHDIDALARPGSTLLLDPTPAPTDDGDARRSPAAGRP